MAEKQCQDSPRTWNRMPMTWTPVPNFTILFYREGPLDRVPDVADFGVVVE